MMKYILAILTFFLLLGCSDQSKQDVKEVTQKIKNIDVEKVVDKSIEKTTQVVNAVSKTVKNTDVKKVIKESTKKVEDITKNVTLEVNKALDSVQKTSIIPSIDGATLFSAKCASCHGDKAQKKALGKSEVIAGWTNDKTKAALHGYKDGSYGKTMKMVMLGQVSSLSDDQIDALADFISKQ